MVHSDYSIELCKEQLISKFNAKTTPVKHAALVLTAYEIICQLEKQTKQLKEELEWTQAAMAEGIRAAGHDQLCEICAVIPPERSCDEADYDCSKCYGHRCTCKECDGGSCFEWIGPQENNV